MIDSTVDKDVHRVQSTLVSGNHLPAPSAPNNCASASIGADIDILRHLKEADS